MRYLALATDYDGTLAHHGTVGEETFAALARLRESGRRIVLVTGRELDDLRRVFDRLDVFDRVVAENGALLYRPDTGEEILLGEPPPAEFVSALKDRGVEPMSVGRVIVATWEPHETAVLEAIRELGLELQVVFNKGAVMVLPSGVNKATGLRAALRELGLSLHNTVGVGDAENDHAFLACCECAVAVANALPALKDRCDLVTSTGHGAGVVELADRMLADDLAGLESVTRRHEVLLGRRDDGSEEYVDPCRTTILVTGTSGSGKSTLATGLLERLGAAGYQFCIVDPEGDYDEAPDTIPVGDPSRSPAVEQVLRALEDPDTNVTVRLVGVPQPDRPQAFEAVAVAMQDLRVRTGRPHWLLLDEAHHLMPDSREPALGPLPDLGDGVVLVTVHPTHIARDVLRRVDAVLAVGDEPAETLRQVAARLGEHCDADRGLRLAPGQALAWWRGRGEPPYRVQPEPPRAERLRHRRKYAEGDLGPDRSFYFRGPDGRLKLRAANLSAFLELADGVDDETWLHHLRAGDYTRWFREYVKDPDLAEAAAAVAADETLAPDESRRRIRAEVDRRYTAPA